MIAIQKPAIPAEAETLEQVCDRYGVAKLVRITAAGNSQESNRYVVYYREDCAHPGMSQFFDLEQAIAASANAPAHLIPFGAPCTEWPSFQQEIKNGVVLYRRHAANA